MYYTRPTHLCQADHQRSYNSSQQEFPESENEPQGLALFLQSDFALLIPLEGGL